MKIYTKTGDNGETGYIGGRISKGADLVETLGNLDELNASLGSVLANAKLKRKTKSSKQKSADLSGQLIYLQAVQSALFEIGAAVATPEPHLKAESLATRLIEKAQELETVIDKLDFQLPVLQNFILPGGAPTGAALHLSRAICRRAERSLVRHIEHMGNSNKPYVANLQAAQVYLNRLSDYLFVLARFTNQTEAIPEQLWQS